MSGCCSVRRICLLADISSTSALARPLSVVVDGARLVCRCMRDLGQAVLILIVEIVIFRSAHGVILLTPPTWEMTPGLYHHESSDGCLLSTLFFVVCVPSRGLCFSLPV